MRGRSAAVAGLGALVLLLSASQAAAQTQARPTSAFELGVGPAVGQGTGLAVHGTAAYVTAPTRFGLAIRLEGMFMTWRARDPVIGGTRVSSLGVNLVQTLSRGAVQPYAIAGGGAYAQPGPGLEFGLNVGAGLRFRLGSASLFTEARVHRLGVENGGRLEPLTFGIRF